MLKRNNTLYIYLFIYLFIYLITFTTTEKQAVVGVAQQSEAPNYSASFYPPNHDIAQMTDHNTGNYMPYPLRQVCGFFYARGGGGGLPYETDGDARRLA